MVSEIYIILIILCLKSVSSWGWDVPPNFVIHYILLELLSKATCSYDPVMQYLPSGAFLNLTRNKFVMSTNIPLWRTQVKYLTPSQ